MTSFNAFGTSEKSIGKTNKPVWLGTVAPHAVGGVLAQKYRVKGLHLPAGTPVNLAAGVIKPVLVYEIKAISESGSPSAVTGITIDPKAYGVLPTTSDKMKLVASGSAVAITAVAPNATDANLLDITIALVGATAGAAVALIPSGESAMPSANGYLYNDIYLGDLSDANATGAVVDFHGEGLLIDFTPAAFMKAAMKSAVPNVIQVEFPDGAFVTE